MKSKSYKEFLKLKCSDRRGSLLELSEYKRENPSEYSAYCAEYYCAVDRILKKHNQHCGFGNVINEKNVLDNSFIRDLNYPQGAN